MDESFSYKQIQLDFERIEREVRQSKLRLIGQLLASSLILVLWYSPDLQLGSAAALPIGANALAWAIWALSQFRWAILTQSIPMGSIDVDSGGPWEYFDYMRFVWRRQKRFELPIDMLTAIQFIVMAFVLFYRLVWGF